MSQFAVLEGYLFRVSMHDSRPVGLNVVDIERGRAFALQRQLESSEAEIIDAVLVPDKTKYVTIATSDAGLTVTYKRVLPSGLELRPQSLAVPSSAEPLSLVALIAELCRENSRLRADAVSVAKESELRTKCLEDMVAEKESYQESMLKRVSAILEDRNARIAAAMPVKEEPVE